MQRKWFLLIGLGLLVFAGWQIAGAATAVTPARQPVLCENGFVGVYPCKNVDLLAHLPLDSLGGGGDIKGNDHWGWTDPDTRRDYVLFGLTDSTAFIDITDRSNPTYLGKLPGHDGASIWRDIKVYQNTAYITADIPTASGLQVFDLTQLRSVQNPPQIFSETNHYGQFGPGHNLWVNADSGFLYVFRSDTCNGEIHMVNIQDALNPTFAGCFAVNDAPLSDSECVIYSGPDADYQGREICFTGSDDNVSIGDVTDKSNPTLIADFTYPGITRAHQGALTPGQRYWLLSDTMDEANFGHNTRTYLFDVADLETPVFLGYFEHPTTARDHNVYIDGAVAYETNWQAGLRVLDIGGLPATDFLEVGYFDIVPDSDSIASEGAWSNYPWWSDGAVTVSGTNEGLFVLQPNFPRIYLPLTLID